MQNCGWYVNHVHARHSRTAQTPTITSTVFTTYTYDAANRLTKVGNTNYTWDNNGNLTNDGSSLYRYNQANRMISTTLATTTTLFSYNGDGVRLKQVIAGVPTTYTQDLAAPLPVVLQAKTGTVATQYLFSLGTRPVAQYTSSAFQYLLPDALGSVRQIADAGGHVILAESYQPYGAVLNSSGSATSIFGYAGEQFDSYIKLLFLRSRYYSPETTRFLSKDSWQGDYTRPQSLDAWAYVEGNPINKVDPSGKWWCGPLSVAGICDNWIESALTRLEFAGPNSQNFWLLFKLHGGGVRFDSQSDPYTYPLFDVIHLPTSYLYVSIPSQDFDNYIALFVHEGVHQYNNEFIGTNRDEAGAYAIEGLVRQEFGLTGYLYQELFFNKIYLALEPDGRITWNLAKLCAIRKVLTEDLYTQDFRLSGLKRWDAWVAQLSPQVITQEIGFDLI